MMRSGCAAGSLLRKAAGFHCRFAATAGKKMAILYGSQTGTGENYARMLGLMASSHGYVPTVKTLDEGIATLKTDRPDALVIVCSTYGTGEFPTNARKMWQALDKKDVKVDGIQFAILGLGNSQNDNFCAAAKSLDSKLTELGATSNLRLKLSCEHAAGGHEICFRDWKKSLWQAFGGGQAASGRLGVVYEVKGHGKHTGTDHHHLNERSDIMQSLRESSFTSTSVASNKVLSKIGYRPEFHEMSLNLSVDQQQAMLGRPHRYDDHIEILVGNDKETVDRAFKALKLATNTVITPHPLPGAMSSVIDNQTFTLRTLIRDLLDFSQLPSRSLLEAFSQAASKKSEKAALEALANDLSAESEYASLSRGVFTILDCLEMFPSVHMSPEEILTHFPRIQARTYSVSSAPAYSGDVNKVTFTYSVAEKKTRTGKIVEGFCTHQLARAKEGTTIYARLVPSGVSQPADQDDVLAVAMGSGVGPIRSLLQQRAVQQRLGKPVGKVDLYYGFRHAGKDQLYVEEFAELTKAGLLTVNYVPSQDTLKFVTPMDRIVEVKPKLSETGHIMYCGLGGGVPLLVEGGLRKAGIDVTKYRATGRYHEEYFTQDLDMENLLVAHTGGSQDANTLAGKFGDCEMFCFQCEQTFKNQGCHKVGVCGKTPRVARLQDLTIHAVKVLGFYCHELRQLGAPENVDANRLTLGAMFMTLTNVNFDEERFVVVLNQVNAMTQKLRDDYTKLCATKNTQPKKMTALALPDALPNADGLVELGKNVGVLTRFTVQAEQSVAGVTEMLVYGMKGLAAYTDHSLMNKKEDATIYKFMHEALAFLLSPDVNDLGKALGLLLECGNINVTAMGMLYNSNATLGVPTPTPVDIKPVPGKCILVSGHDLIMLKGLLEKTEPLGINVYTHGEMLPAHSYPELKKHKNLVGHFGGAWMRQAVEFPHFPGAIVMTTNCLTEPQEDYKATIFTAGAVGWSKIPHLGDNMDTINWTPAIEAAQKMKGFTAKDSTFTYTDPVGQPRAEKYTVGFGHETILSVAPTIVEQIKKGNITRFFVVGGCDGFEGPRSYYTELVKKLPKTAVVLTVGCGKYRFNHLEKELGTIGDTGIPRILDMGQCNDSFSAVQVALALAKVLDCPVSDLPLSIVLSWFEQKAIAVLLSCLKLGLKPIHVGPSLPAFLTPDVLDVLVKDFGLRVCGDPEEDLKVMLAANGMA